jgi:hypothetical protein
MDSRVAGGEMFSADSPHIPNLPNVMFAADSTSQTMEPKTQFSVASSNQP